jgi:hypothetical protein
MRLAEMFRETGLSVCFRARFWHRKSFTFGALLRRSQARLLQRR